jgi:ABC-type antimicrobial peptide transport system permease subunit
MFLVARSEGDPLSLAAGIRDRVRHVDPDIPTSAVRTMEERVQASLASPRLQAGVLGTFASLALALAGVGIYGLMAYTMRQRTREIGIRMAIGADPRSILAFFLRKGVAIVCAGIVVGLAAAFVLTRVLRSQLFEVSTTDPMVFAAVTVVLAAVAITAVSVPAHRATRLEPVAALRED